MGVEEIKKLIRDGTWASIAPEIRPSSIKNADGTLKPFYLTRVFKYISGDKFELLVQEHLRLSRFTSPKHIGYCRVFIETEYFFGLTLQISG